MNRPPDEHERIVAFGWIMFSLMLLYMLVSVLTRGCAIASGLIR
jgi:hypothetical protein